MSDSNNPPSTVSLQTELGDLDTILFRFASTPDDKFESAVLRVLPNVLLTLLRNEQQIKDKSIEILNHILKRLKALQNIQLPVKQLTELFTNESYAQNIIFNTFCLLFIEKGFQRLKLSEKHEYGPLLINNMHSKLLSQQKTCLYLFLQSLIGFEYRLALQNPSSPTNPAEQTNTVNMHVMTKEEELEATYLRFPFASNPADKQILLQYFTDFLLYQPVYTKPAPKKADNSNNAIVNSILNNNLAGSVAASKPAEAEKPVQTIPDGLSESAVNFVLNDKKITLDHEQLNEYKIAILNFINNSSVISDNEALPLLLISSTVGSDAVQRLADNSVRRLKAINTEDPSLITQLYQLMLGSVENSKIPSENRRLPAPLGLKLRILAYLSKSVLATNQMAYALKAIFDALFGQQTNYWLKSAALMFSAWLISKSAGNIITPVAQILINGLLKFLALAKQQNPATNTNNTAETEANHTENNKLNSSVQTSADHLNSQLRGRVYSLLGQLSHRVPALFNSNTKMLQLFFQALREERDDQTLQNIHEGLGLLRFAYIQLGENKAVLAEIKKVCMGMIESDDKRVRLNSLSVLNRLFEFHDVEARFVCLLLLADESVEVRDEARKGLTPFALKQAKHADENKSTALSAAKAPLNNAADAESKEGKDSEMDTSEPEIVTESSAVGRDSVIQARKEAKEAATVEYPAFPAFIYHAASELQVPKGLLEASTVNASATALQIDRRVFSQLLEFAAECLKQTSAHNNYPAPADYVAVLSSSPEKESISVYQRLIEYAIASPYSELQGTASQYLHQLVELRPEIFAQSFAVRLDWIRKYLLGSNQQTRANLAILLALIASALSAETCMQMLKEFQSICSQALSTISQVNSHAAVSDAIHGSLLGLGVLIAEVSKRKANPWLEQSSLFTEELLESCCGEIISRLDIATMQRDASITAAACISIARIGEAGALPVPVQADSSNSGSVGSSVEPAKKFKSTRYSRQDVVNRLLDLTKVTERKGERVMEEAIRALASLIKGDQSSTFIRLILDGLFKLVSLKHEEVHFAIGEALATIGEVTSTYENTLQSNMQIIQPAASSPTSNSATDFAAEATGTLVASEISISSSANAMEEIVAFAAKNLQRGSMVQRSSCCVWLLCLVKFSGENIVIQRMLPTIQQSFTLALTDSNQFTQECAAKGLSVLYDKTTDGKIREELVAALMKTFNVGQRRVQGDTAILVDEERGEYSTYKELCSVANDINQPDLIYKFLDLASHHSIWNSKLGAAFSLNTILKANEQLAPHLKSLIPKLYRYQFDSNEKIKNSMKLMWQSLVDDPRTAINQNFNEISKDLLKAQGSKQFRVRHSACLALTDLLSGRSFEQVGSYLNEIWANTFRCLDDINEKVRQAAVILAGTLGNLSVRLSDPKYTDRKDATAAMNVVIPVLLEEGINSRQKEIQSISIRCLLNIIKIGGQGLKPHVPEVLGTVLESMSTMEPAQFSYLQQHAASYNVSQEDLELARLSVAKSSPLAEAVTSCLNLVDESTIEAVLNKISDIIRTGLGLATLTAAARFIVNLVNSSVASHMRDHSSNLISSLQSGLSDPSVSVRRVYAQALGYLCKVGKKKRVGRLINELCSSYIEGKSAASVVLALRHMCNYGGSTVKDYATEIIPTASIGLFDSDKEVQQEFQLIWDELTPGTTTGYTLYAAEIVKFYIPLFDSSSWQLRQTVFRSLNAIVETIKAKFEPFVPLVLPILLKSMPGRLWTGKETVLTLVVSIAVECKAVLTAQQIEEIYVGLLEELQRNKSDYKTVAVQQLGRFLAKFPAIPQAFGQTKAALQTTIDLAIQYGVKSDAEMKRDEEAELAHNTTSLASATVAKKDLAAEEDKSKRVDASLLVAVYECLGKAWPQSNSSPDWSKIQVENSQYMLNALNNSLKAGLNWVVRVALLHAYKEYVSNLDESLLKSVVPQMNAMLAGQMHDTKHSAVREAAVQVLITLFQRKSALQSLLTEPALRSSIDSFESELAELTNDKDSRVLLLVDQAKQLTKQLRK
jgi:proteasome component ECM29